MKAWELLGEAQAPDGTEMRLTRHTSELVILASGRSLEDKYFKPHPAGISARQGQFSTSRKGRYVRIWTGRPEKISDLGRRTDGF